MARKTHGTGTVARHRRSEGQKSLKHEQHREKQLFNKSLRNRKKKRTRAIKILKAVTKPEILKQWARKESLIAKNRLNKRRIKQFTYYCRLLAIDSLYLKHMPKNAIRIKKGTVFRPSKKGTLGKIQKRDLLEKLNEMEIAAATRKKIVEEEVKKLQKGFPKFD